MLGGGDYTVSLTPDSLLLRISTYPCTGLVTFDFVHNWRCPVGVVSVSLFVVGGIESTCTAKKKGQTHMYIQAMKMVL